MRKVLTALLLMMFAFITAYAENKPYKTVILGDSITQIGTYPAMFQLFAASRTEGGSKRIDAYNAGVGGNTSGMGLRRLNQDIFRRNPDEVIVMFGMNDVGRHVYKSIDADENTQKTRDMFYNNYVKNMTELVKAMKDKNIKVVLMTPSPYDENGTSAKSQSSPGINTVGITRCAAFVRELAKAEDLKLIDLHKEITELQDKHPDMMFSGNDRVHPMDFGALAITSAMLKGYGLDKVSELFISKGAASQGGDGASASGIEYNDNGVSFTYEPKNLPMAKTADYEKLNPIMDLDGTVNREIIKVADLAPGNYEMKVAGKTVGTFSNAELSAGVNIAVLDTPSQQQAVKLYRNMLNNIKSAAGLASKLSGAVQNVKSRETAEADFDKWIASANNDKAREMRQKDKEYYFANVDKAEEIDQDYVANLDKLYAEAKVAPYKIELIRQ